MSYQVLARKWRPRNFSELAGQEHVLRALIHALDNNRLHHAFLFTGTRGVGKTTIARILAKSLNCETGITSKPCGACSSCREIDEGRFVDLIEVDAASRTKVEDTRELLENVQYSPTRGRYKVYLIDEVHMLSTHSFNALLKTLEEPPPHVKFLLATTDPQRLPITILSRCLQFNLKRLPLPLIQKQLQHILAQEQVPFEAAAISLIARAADGSMRDALSLLDQAIAFAGGNVSETEVRGMLGTIEHQHVYALLDALARRDASALFAHVVHLEEIAPDFVGVLAELVSVLHRIALTQAVPGALDDDAQDKETISRLAAAVSAEDLQLFYQIALLGRRDLPLAPDPRSGFEMVLLRMLAFQPQSSGTISAPPPTAPTPRAAPTHSASPTPTAKPATTPSSNRATDWAQVVAALDVGGLTKQLAANCIVKEQRPERIALELHPSHAQLLNDKALERLQGALQTYFKQPLKLSISVGQGAGDETPAQRQDRQRVDRQEAAQHSVQNDVYVRSLLETFNAKIDMDSIQPPDSS